MAEETWVVHWDGPFTLTESKKKKDEKDGFVLYQLLGLHHLYGSNVLLYIGQTKRGIETRLGEHEKWIDYEYDAMKVRLGSIAKFTSWTKWEEQEDPFPYPTNDAIIEKIEKLLILSNQPAYNTSNKESAKTSKELRVFNTGRLGPIFPEVSSWYFLDQ